MADPTGGQRPGALRVELTGPADFAGFRTAARLLLQNRVQPQDVVWIAGDGRGDLFGSGVPVDWLAAVLPPTPAPAAAPRVKPAFLETAGAASLHRHPGRFALIYRVLSRLVDEPRLLSLASDPDIIEIADFAKAVRRDIHKMHAFVRFRELSGPHGEAFVAWYEPDHHVVEAAAPFFARRFASLLWTILTPERSAHWDGDRLAFGPGAAQRDAPGEDRLEDLWRTYYANIFNPARVNPEAMRAEMPKRFWRNLPEAALIKDMIAGAPSRTAAMIASAPTLPVRRRGAEIDASVPASAEPGLASLSATLAACRACPLWEHATQAVPGQGPAAARLMLVGEQPGDEEDIAGRPFVGPAGRLLDEALQKAGVPRRQLYLTNAVKHFKFEPRGRRRIHKRPSAGEIHACLPWLRQELDAVGPAVVVLLGASAAKAVLGQSVPVTSVRGKPFPLPDGRTALVTTHPSYILRLPDDAARTQAFEALVADLRLAASLADVEPADLSGSVD